MTDEHAQSPRRTFSLLERLWIAVGVAAFQVVVWPVAEPAGGAREKRVRRAVEGGRSI